MGDRSTLNTWCSQALDHYWLCSSPMSWTSTAEMGAVSGKLGSAEVARSASLYLIERTYKRPSVPVRSVLSALLARLGTLTHCPLN